MNWELVIGLEIHVQLLTHTKIFSPAPTAYGQPPNSQVQAVDLGLPGALPVLNRGAVECAIRLGLAIDATVNQRSEFARKNYFYPDLPKGYQISQFEFPVVSDGHIMIRDDDGNDGDEEDIRIGITRAHLEEDAGKLIHDLHPQHSAVDLNRAGVPLLEIVSEPDLRSILQAVRYATQMHQLVQWVGICDGNMQEGSFRMDANISVRRSGEPFGTRCEIKNLNSFRFLEQALKYEQTRQIELVESGGEVVQETRLFDTAKGETRSMRSKEDAHDYRYFPDPDLPPLLISDEWIAAVRATLPELPQARRARFCADYQLSDYDAAQLTSDKAFADYYEQVLGAVASKDDVAAIKAAAKLVANWMSGDLSALLNEHKRAIDDCPISHANFAGLIKALQDNTISGKIAKAVIVDMWESGASADEIIERKGLKQISDSGALEKIAQEVVAAHPQQAEQYRQGKDKLLGFFVGQMMKATQGRSNPEQANQLLRRLLDEGKQ